MRRNRRSQYLFGMTLMGILFSMDFQRLRKRYLHLLPLQLSPRSHRSKGISSKISCAIKKRFGPPLRLERDDAKVSTQRARPDAERERSEFFDGGKSFPSGHSVQAWAVATVIANEHHDQRKVQLAAYGVASAVSLARFTAGKHYISDVLIGSLLGYGIFQYVYRTHHQKETDSADTEEGITTSVWPEITPRYNRRMHQYGVALTWSF